MLLEDKLIKFRKAAGYTQQDVADLLNVERSTYAGYETGKAVIPIRKLQLLAVIYNIDLNAFNTNEVLVFQSPHAKKVIRDDPSAVTREERLLLSRIRIIKAMGKTEQLESALEKLMDIHDDEEKQ